MNILYLADSASWHNAKWTEYFAPKHRVVLFSDRKPEYRKQEFHPAVEIVEIDPLVRTRSRHFNKLSSLYKMKRQAEILLRSRRFDVIHAIALYYAYLGSWLRTDLPMIYTPQGSEILLRARANPFYAHMARRTYKRAQAVTSDSRVLLDSGTRFGARSERSYLIQNGVDLSCFTPVGPSVRDTLGLAEGTFVLFSPRALTPLYNIPDILSALRLLKDRGLRFKAVISYAFGDEYLDGYRRRAQELRIEQQLHWQGPIPYSSMPQWYRAADAVVSVPSSDSSPKTVYEAMATGVPVIVSDLPWAEKSLADGRHALKVPVGAPNAIADAVISLATSPDLCRRLASEGRSLVNRDYDFHDHMARMERLLFEVARGRTPAPAELARHQ